MGVLPQIGLQSAIVQAAQGYGIAGDFGVEGAEAHQVDGRFEHRHPIQGRVAGQGKGHAFIAAGDISLEAGAVEVVGTAFAGKSGLATSIFTNEYAVVVSGVLVQQPGPDEVSDYLGVNATFLEIGEHPVLVCVRRGQGEGRFFPGLRPGRWVVGGVPRPVAVKVQQVIHRLREALAAELLAQGNPVRAQRSGSHGERRSKGARVVFADRRK